MATKKEVRILINLFILSTWVNLNRKRLYIGRTQNTILFLINKTK
jgi:hypothetical protein